MTGRGWNRHYQCILGIRLGLQWKLMTLDKPFGFLILKPSGVCSRRLEWGLGLDLSGLCIARVVVSIGTVEVSNIHGQASDGNQVKSS